MMLNIKDLVSGYGRLKILYNINLSLSQGEILSIVGPNGAGKTTLLNSITGFAKIFNGKILYNENDITGEKPEKMPLIGISYVPQMFNVFPSLTVEENLLVAGEILRSRELLRQSLEEIYTIFPILRERRSEGRDIKRRRETDACNGQRTCSEAQDTAFGRAHLRIITKDGGHNS